MPPNGRSSPRSKAATRCPDNIGAGALQKLAVSDRVETDTTFLDAFTTTDRAVAIARGQQFNQKAIFDLSVYEEIPTGGTGIAPENMPSIEERLSILFPPGYVPEQRYAEPTQKIQGAPTGERGAPAEAEGAVAGGAQRGAARGGRRS